MSVKGPNQAKGKGILVMWLDSADLGLEVGPPKALSWWNFEGKNRSGLREVG